MNKRGNLINRVKVGGIVESGDLRISLLLFIMSFKCQVRIEFYFSFLFLQDTQAGNTKADQSRIYLICRLFCS